jgi:hypothetical protein
MNDRARVTVTGYGLGIRAFPYSPLGIQLAEGCDGRHTVPGPQSDTALDAILLKPRAQSGRPADYERQFRFDRKGGFRPVYLPRAGTARGCTYPGAPEQAVGQLGETARGSRAGV